jgi:carbon monoxide dehydrogenase subunit G
MKIAGSYNLDVPRERLWSLIFDPAVLLQLIPGCEQIEQAGNDVYRGRITLRLPAVSGSFDTHFKIVESEPPSFCRFQGEAGGSSGSIKAQGAFRLRDEGYGTVVEYECEALVGRPLASMNPRFMEGVAQMFIRQGLERLRADPRARDPLTMARPGERPPSASRSLLQRMSDVLARFDRWRAARWTR